MTTDIMSMTNGLANGVSIFNVEVSADATRVKLVAAIGYANIDEAEKALKPAAPALEG